jgi:uncharacterized protein YukE
MSLFRFLFGETFEAIREIQAFAAQVEEIVELLGSNLGPIAHGAWTGQGAAGFIEEMNTRVIPELNALAAVLGTFGLNLNSVADLIRDADDSVIGEALALASVIDSIY